MIKQFAIRNFKSIAKLIVDTEKFNVLIGLNGAGKTTLLQSLDFISHVMRGDVTGWISRRGWDSEELACKFVSERNIRFRMRFSFSGLDSAEWAGEFSRKDFRCIRETIKVQGADVLVVRDNQYKLYGDQKREISFKYEGSILSVLRDEELKNDLIEIRNYVQSIRSLDLLAPHLMRHRARDADDDIGHGGETLSAFLYGLKGAKKEHVLVSLRKFYPNLVDFKVSSLRSGWKRLSVYEEIEGKKIEIHDKHINDGLLRILAFIAQSETDRSFLIFDEIENGISPEIIQGLISFLEGAGQQILVTTHSPMILNYLSDETAKKSVFFMYKTGLKGTRARRFFDIPRLSEKLNIMGPGEAFVDTDLVVLTEECANLDISDEAKKGNALS